MSLHLLLSHIWMFLLLPKIRAQHLTCSWKSVWCVWQNTVHTECLLAIYGNVSVASAANSRSNCSRLNIHIATLRTWTEETFFCEKSGNVFGVWEIGVWEKIEQLDSKHRFWMFLGPIWAHLFIVSTVLLPWCQRSPSGWYSKRSCRTWCLHLFQAARHDARQAMETQ